MFDPKGERGVLRILQMPKNLVRLYGKGDLHFITFSCERRLALLGTTRARNAFVRALGEVRENLLKMGYGNCGWVMANGKETKEMRIWMPFRLGVLVQRSLRADCAGNVRPVLGLSLYRIRDQPYMIRNRPCFCRLDLRAEMRIAVPFHPS
jgi:hypothetical protein